MKAQLRERPIVGGAFDLFKCFDQIVRLLLYPTLTLSGLPHGVFVGYMAFQPNLVVYNSMACALGGPHKHPCGIPLGCPLSVVFIIILLLRAWLAQMSILMASPRAMADDILLVVFGPRALNQFHHAFNQAVQHLQEIGGRIASSK